MSHLNAQGHATSNNLMPPSGGGQPRPAQDSEQMVLTASSTLTPDTSASYSQHSPSFVGSSRGVAVAIGGAHGDSLRRDSSTTSTSNSSPVIAAAARAQGVMNRRGVKVNNKRGPSKTVIPFVGAGMSSSSGAVANKRRCVSNACIACRKRKSKCDGNTPSCAACSSVYGTECVYDPSSDHRRKGVYKKDIDNLKTRNGTLQTLIQAILDSPEAQVMDLVHAMRSSDNLEEVAEAVLEGKYGTGSSNTETKGSAASARGSGDDRAFDRSMTWSMERDGDPSVDRDDASKGSSSDREPTFESELSQRMSQLRVDAESGQVRFIGGTSNLILLPSQVQNHDRSRQGSPNFGRELERSLTDPYATDRERNPILSWTQVLGSSTQACEAIDHLLQMYFSWHYPYFTTLSRELFFRDFRSGYSSPITGLSPRYMPESPSFNRHSPSPAPSQTQPMRYCTPLLLNAMLALGCHFTAHPLARKDKADPDTAGDHFFNECKRLILENDEHVTPRLTTVQALALMSVREAGCAREERGWSYSGMSFRMGIEMGLNLDLDGRSSESSHHEGTAASRQRAIGKGGRMNEEELDARRITFWGCFLFDKCWSNYMGRMPQLPTAMASVPKYIIIPSEDAAEWYPYTDVGKSMISAQPARTRAVALQIIELCEISSDLLIQFYNPNPKKSNPGVGSGSRASNTAGGMGKSDIRNLGGLWHRLEDWRKKLPRELEPQQGCLPPVLLMHMFHQLLYIHLFRPFLQSTSATLPTLSLDPRKICVEAASRISKYLRFYKREYGLRQICNIAAYMIHSACTIHLLNLSEKSAKRDIVQGLRSLEDMAEGWLCARRALVIMRILAKRWKIDLPDEAIIILARAAKGRAEQFRLEEVMDEDYESSYLDYRGSSASAVSPMSLASEPSKHGTATVGQGHHHNDPSGMEPEAGHAVPNIPPKSTNLAVVNITRNVSPAHAGAPSPEPREHLLRKQQQQQPNNQEKLSQVAPGFIYNAGESAASSPGTYPGAPSSPFSHQLQPAYQGGQTQRHGHFVERAAAPGMMQNMPGVPASTSPAPQAYQAQARSPIAPQLSRDPSNISQPQQQQQQQQQQQYTYFDHPQPPSSIASPSAFYSDTGIPIGYGDTPEELQGGEMEQSWCIRDQELVARGFLVQSWMSGELSGHGRGHLPGGGGGVGVGEVGVGVGRVGGGGDEGGGGDGETPWDPFTVY